VNRHRWKHFMKASEQSIKEDEETWESQQDF